MTVRNVVVSHRAINEALRPKPSTPGLETTAAPAPSGVGGLFDAIRAAVTAPAFVGAEAASLTAQLSEALSVLEANTHDPDILTAVEHPMASLLQSFLAERAEKQAEEAAAGFEVKFDDVDIFGWVGSFFTWWRGLRKHAWQAPPLVPEGFGNALRVAVLGDWGTGLYGAPACAESIAAAKGFGLLLHLGDVYYSGTEKEVKQRFLELWPDVPGSVSRALNSNHEMYTGGHAYFNMTLDCFGQSSSCFAMQNDHWLLVGLDSAYEEHDLAMHQAEWLQGLVEAAGGRRVVLFSHHQPYSLLDAQGPKLVARLGALLAARRIFAWYWGHEHRCVVHDPHPAWGLFGRCIGHSGYPYFRSRPADASLELGDGDVGWYRLPEKNLVPSALLLDGPNPFVEGRAQRYGPNGYASLEFDGPNLVERIHAPDGSVLLRQSLTQ